MAEGVDEGDIFPISAVTGQGVLPLVRRVRQVLDQLGPAEQVSTRCDTAQIARDVGGEAQNSREAASCLSMVKACNHGQHVTSTVLGLLCISRRCSRRKCA